MGVIWHCQYSLHFYQIDFVSKFMEVKGGSQYFQIYLNFWHPKRVRHQKSLATFENDGLILCAEQNLLCYIFFYCSYSYSCNDPASWKSIGVLPPASLGAGAGF